jgi:hypothetical protein
MSSPVLWIPVDDYSGIVYIIAGQQSTTVGEGGGGKESSLIT